MYKGMGKTHSGDYAPGMTGKSDGPESVPSKAGNPKTGMGVTSGRAGTMSQGGDPGGSPAGLARAKSAKNTTGKGPQGFRG